MKAGESLGLVSPANFQEMAQKTIARYSAKGKLIDAMWWQRIIGFYENALKQKSAGG